MKLPVDVPPIPAGSRMYAADRTMRHGTAIPRGPAWRCAFTHRLSRTYPFPLEEASMAQNSRLRDWLEPMSGVTKRYGT